MLPRASRLTGPADFGAVVREGVRAGGPLLVVHLMPGPSQEPARVGFVVSGAVGPAVVRNRVRRRLRHLVRDRLGTLVLGDRVVVRAQAAAARASYGELAEALDRCLERCRAKVPTGGAAVGEVRP